MRRTTVKLPDEVDDLLRHEAERKGMTISEVTREAIEEYLGIRPRRKFVSAEAGSSGGQNLASRVDEILAEGFGDWRS
jgi:Arc/MetJ-type ribon-helix-helix transcriptional regulator